MTTILEKKLLTGWERLLYFATLSMSENHKRTVRDTEVSWMRAVDQPASGGSGRSRSRAFPREEMGLMRTRTGWLAWLLTAGMALVPPAVSAQDVPQPCPLFPLPLNDRPAQGGIYTALEFITWMETNPMSSQVLAVRGLVDVDGSQFGIPGQFVGSARPALSVNQISGPESYQPGLRATVGWDFGEGFTIEARWAHVLENRYSATASLIPPGLRLGAFGEESFLFSPVFNFPITFAGPDMKSTLGNAGANFGIWNGATLETIQLIQRHDQVDLRAHIPVYDNHEDFRCYGLLGARYVWFWERFNWRTVATDKTGVSTPIDVANYDNVVSNRMYGVNCGCGNEWFLCDTPIGSFSVYLDVGASLLLDFVKERAGYELGDKSTAARRSKNIYTFAPELQGALHFVWYPTRSIQVQLGWEAYGFFNTVAAPNPVDFNFGALAPPWERIFRLVHGLNFGVGLLF
jgi:hypothetical protein